MDKHIYISIWLYSKGWVPAGVCTFNETLGYSGFSYFDSYIQNDYPPLNPATLNYKDQNSRHFIIDPKKNSQMLDRTFWELLPGTGDFGHQALVSRHPEYQSFNNAQKLYFLGTRMVGGLASYTKKLEEEANIDSIRWLDEIRKDAVSFHTHELERVYQSNAGFLAMTSYGGVRPKAMYQDNDGSFWIAKFNLPSDPYDMALAEHVAITMAKDCGLTTPKTKVVTLPSGENVFLTERFDRKGNQRIHSLSLFSLAPGAGLPKTPTNPSMGTPSSVMATILRRFSDFKDIDTARLVTKLLIDIGFNNTDNHLRNTRLILNADYKWELSPLFDVLFNPRSQPHMYNPAGLPIEQTHLNSENLLQGIVEQTQIDTQQAEKQILLVKSVTKKWEDYCDTVGMCSNDKQKIQAAVSLGLNRQELNYRIMLDQRRKIDALLSKPMPKLKK